MSLTKLYGLLLITILAACQQSEIQEEPINYAVLTGKIINPDSTKKMANLYFEREKDTLMLDAAGNFEITVELDKANIFNIAYGRQWVEVYLDQGDSVHYEFDNDNPDDSKKFSGDKALENNYLIAFAKFRSENDMKIRALLSLEEERFKGALDSMLYSWMGYFADFIKANPGLDKGFETYERSREHYDWAMAMLRYPGSHKYYAKLDEFEVSESYKDYLNEINLNDADLIHIPEYRSFVVNYLSSEVQEEFKRDTTLVDEEYADLRLTFEHASKLFTVKKVIDYVLYKQLLSTISNSGTKGVGSYYTEYNKTGKNEKYKRALKKQYDKWSTIAEGTPSPSWAFRDMDSNMVSLTDLKGKYVYIDVWATWCGPCRGEIPYLKSLEEDYHDKNVAFVSICIADQKAKWKTMVADEELAGYQLYGGEKWKNAITDGFLINGIPRFIIIDPEGKIVDPVAPRPSGSIREVFDELGV
ncbi:TlpA family protein disulfide reductase [bacterium AH-315-C07]|nr:TlpA family protein disulfide reductase [bacterium AH-315-C07]